MDETQLILQAISRPSIVLPKKKKFVMKEIEPSVFDDSQPDAILEITKKKSKAVKSRLKRDRKSITDWTATDFLLYIRQSLSTHGLSFMISGVRDSAIVNKIYDFMVDRLATQQMSNAILKDYFDWWVSSHAPFLHEQVKIYDLSQEFEIEKFLKRFKSAPVKELNTKQVPTVSPSNISDEEVLKLGGIQMLLSTRGIVITCAVLRKNNTEQFLLKVSSALRGLSENSVKQVIRKTIELAPYNKEDSVDFMSISRNAIEYHGIKDFKNISYQDYFH